MQYHEVKINLEFEEKANLTAAGTLAGDISSASLWVDYIFLDTDERRRFAQLSHEYLITQLQFTGDEALVSGNNRVKLNFNHPVQELVWVGVPNGVTSNQWTTYTNGGANMTTSAKLQLNGHDRFAERKGDYFNKVQPFQHHENVPSNKGINVYSFALQPEQHQPSGTLNMSRIDTAVLSLTSSAAGKVKTFASNYNVLRIMSGHPPGPKKLRARCVNLGNHAIASSLIIYDKRARILVVREPPESLTYQGCVGNSHLAKRNELGYGNNGKDWAIRILTVYVRMRLRALCEDMTGCQRLNGIRSSIKRLATSDGLRYSPSLGETQGNKRWAGWLCNYSLHSGAAQ